MPIIDLSEIYSLLRPRCLSHYVLLRVSIDTSIPWLSGADLAGTEYPSFMRLSWPFTCETLRWSIVSIAAPRIVATGFCCSVFA